MGYKWDTNARLVCFYHPQEIAKLRLNHHFLLGLGQTPRLRSEKRAKRHEDANMVMLLAA